MRPVPLALICTLLASAAQSAPSTAPRVDRPTIFLESLEVLGSTGSSLHQREVAGPDTFVLYGGPASLEGKFQSGIGAPDWQGWEGFDDTKDPVYWQVSTHNAGNLGGHGIGNRAYWCGQTEEQAPHFVHAPGYGASWNAIIQYESDPVADPTQGQTLNLDFFLNYDVEPAYDAVMVEVDRAGTWERLHDYYWQFSGTNRDASDVFAAPGVRFSDVAQSVVVFNGNDYGGPDGDRVRVRIRVISDGAFDDQTGLWPTVGGACQIDDITLSHDGFSAFEDFEGPGPYLFEPAFEPFVGDFSEIFPFVTDDDPYHENPSPLAMFVDYGQTVRNGPGPDGTTSTGGSLSTTRYGIDGDYVVNFTGGLSGGTSFEPLSNRILSPWITWELPGPEDDDGDIVGAELSFDVYVDLPLENGLFYQWFLSPGERGELFGNDNTVYYSRNGPRWERVRIDISDYVGRPAVDSLRIALGVGDFSSDFGLPGGAATPAPYFDNVTLKKYRLDGLRLRTVEANLLQSDFPYGGGIDASTQATRNSLMVIPNSNSTFAAFEAEFEAFIEGTSFAEARAFWALKKNLLFEDEIRQLPADVHDENLVIGPEIWTGERRTHRSFRERKGFTFPLPTSFYPGDQFEYYFQGTDDAGNITTLPRDIRGFGQFDGTFDQRYHLRALPSIQNSTNDQPEILLYFGGGASCRMDLAVAAMRELGMVEGTDFDLYLSPNGGARRTLGSAAGLIQIDRYSTIFVFTGGGDDSGLASYQQNFGANTPREGKGLDTETITLLDSWSASPGNRNLVVFGSYLGLSLGLGTGNGPTFLANSLGAARVDDDVRDLLSDTASPAVEPTTGGFAVPFVVGGSADRWCGLDQLEPLASAVRGHAYATDDGGVHPTAAASILKVETTGDGTKVHLTFPFAFQFVQSAMHRAPVQRTARAALLADILAVLDAPTGSGFPTSAPPRMGSSLSLAPNPFNPATTIELQLERPGRVTVDIFSARGQRVLRVHHGDLPAGRTTFEWNGRDERGASVASGLYVVKARAGSVQLEEKALLLK